MHKGQLIFLQCAIAFASGELASVEQGQNVQIQTVSVAGTVSMLIGQGGNMGLCVGEDGAFLIDDQFAPLSEKIQAAISKLTDKPVRFVVNTHWHGDHTGGNENFGKAGAIIVAHENVRKRMSVEQFLEAFNDRTPAAPKAALPVITFEEEVRFYWNDEEIHVMHLENAHTDGDSIIHFKKANVLHMGDIYFNGLYPFIDGSTGGSIDGVIAAVTKVIERFDENTKIIPGHGSLSNMKELEAYLHMLEAVREKLAALIAEGKTADEIVASKPTKDFDADWGKGFLPPDQWVRIVLGTMMKQ